MKLRKIIQEIVGSTYRYALFYNFPGGLRFELSEGSSPLDQVLSAMHKATVICNDVFAEDERILVHLEAYAPTSRFGMRTMLRELHVAGIIVPEVRDVWLEVEEQSEADENPTGLFLCCAFEVPATKLQNLLWCALTSDLGPLRPKPRCRVYLVNSDSGIVVHPYDDRGMDVISKNSSALTDLYERHNDMLLADDIAAMRDTFAPSA